MYYRAMLTTRSLLSWRSALSPCISPCSQVLAPACWCSSDASPTPPTSASSRRPRFQPLDLGTRRRLVRNRQRRSAADRPAVSSPRADRMPVDQHWPSAWPTARSFHPASVPLPLRQSYVDRPLMNARVGKWANPELIKLANFLHLTPPAIRLHCDALRRFCTEWPTGLDDAKMDRLLPMEVITCDFVHASPSIRHPEARVVSVRVSVSALQLTGQQRDKLLRLMLTQYDRRTDSLLLTASQCPFRRQNYDYAVFLLTACCGESRRQHSWEALRTRADHEDFQWSGSSSQRACHQLGLHERSEEVTQYATAVDRLLNEGETRDSIDQYRTSVLRLLQLNLHSAPHANTDSAS